MTTNIDNLVEQLGKLTVIEAGELSKRLEEAWGLDLSALTNAPVQEPVEEVKTTATVVLTGFEDGKKIPVLQKVRKYKDMGLMEAKNFVEDLPGTVLEDILKEEAETMKQQLEEAGGIVELK
jgi:large subunit ribosomal protein L7/L12